MAKKSLTNEEREMLTKLAVDIDRLKALRPVVGADACPFCGATSVDIDGYDEEFWIVCDVCGAVGPGGNSPVQAVEKWNTRKK